MNAPSSLENLFFTALEQGSPAERAKYLDVVCEDCPEIRRELEKLLRAHTRMGGFLGKTAVEQFDLLQERTDTLQGGATPADAATSEDDDHFSLEPSTQPDSLGRVGHFEVLEVLGRGGFGTVFRAFDEKLQRSVAIKVLAPQLANSIIARKRFVAEARLCARIRHVSVVHVYAVEDGTPPYLVMEIIPGETLQERLNRAGPLGARDVVRIGRQIAEGLAAAHDIGLIHRDVKPENILLEPDWEEQSAETFVKISDFGLARAADDVSMSQFGIVAGTPMYMAPEQAMGEPLDFRADLFSLGSVLYTMCCGQQPFCGKSTFAVQRKVVEEPPRPIREIVPEVPQWLCEIIARLHAKKPEDRIQSAREVACLLGQSLTDERQSPELIPSQSNSSLATKRPAPENNSRDVMRARHGRPGTRRDWAITLAVLMILVVGLGFTEATGVTSFRGTIIRLFSPEGTIVVEVDDPDVSVRVDGSELVISGAGVREIRLTPGNYEVEASMDGRVISRELVTVTNNGRQIVKVSREAADVESAVADSITVDAGMTDAAAWEQFVIVLPIRERAQAVIDRLMVVNPGFDGKYLDPLLHFDVRIEQAAVQDISPLRVMPGLQKLRIVSDRLSDLSPLQGLPLTDLDVFYTQVADLSPLHGMSLQQLDLSASMRVTDLSPLKGIPLSDLSIANTQVADLTPLIGMNLTCFNCDSSKVTDLSPLNGMRLTTLIIYHTSISDLSPLTGMPLVFLKCSDSLVDDASLIAISECRQLAELQLNGTKVTATGIERLSQALPGCRIEWDRGVIERR